MEKSCHIKGHEKNGRLAQLARALLSHGRGHEFESRTAHHLILQGYFGQVLLGSPKCSFYFSAKFRSASLESISLLIWYGRAKKTFRWPCLESRSGTPVNFIYHSNILDLQSDFFMLFSY